MSKVILKWSIASTTKFLLVMGKIVITMIHCGTLYSHMFARIKGRMNGRKTVFYRVDNILYIDRTVKVAAIFSMLIQYSPR